MVRIKIKRTPMNWHDIFEALDTPSGHIILLTFFFILSVGLWYVGYPNWEQLEGPILGALLMRLTGMKTLMEKKNGHEKPPPPVDNELEKRVQDIERQIKI